MLEAWPGWRPSPLPDGFGSGAPACRGLGCVQRPHIHATGRTTVARPSDSVLREGSIRGLSAVHECSRKVRAPQRCRHEALADAESGVRPARSVRLVRADDVAETVAGAAVPPGSTSVACGVRSGSPRGKRKTGILHRALTGSRESPYTESGTPSLRSSHRDMRYPILRNEAQA